MSCSELSLAAGEPLPGTATVTGSWLLVEVRGAWGRDAVEDSPLPDDVRETLQAFAGRALLVRRPGRRRSVTVVRAVSAEDGGHALRLELERLEDLPDAALDEGVPVGGPIVLVCAHGRRDACCARLGVPLYEALAAHLPSASLWQSSHLGGHRFAPNVVALPAGVQLGRVAVAEAAGVATSLLAGRIPLDHYRGRTLYPAPVQAAEVALRRLLGLDGLGDLRLLAHEDGVVRFAAAGHERVVHVDEKEGPAVPASCGAEPEPTRVWRTRITEA